MRRPYDDCASSVHDCVLLEPHPGAQAPYPASMAQVSQRVLPASIFCSMAPECNSTVYAQRHSSPCQRLTAFDCNNKATHLVAVTCKLRTSAAHYAQAPGGSEVAASRTAQLWGHLARVRMMEAVLCWNDSSTRTACGVTCWLLICRLRMAIGAAAAQPVTCMGASGCSQHAAVSVAGRRLAGQQQIGQGSAGREAPSGLCRGGHGGLGQSAGLSSTQGTFTKSANVV